MGNGLNELGGEQCPCSDQQENIEQASVKNAVRKSMIDEYTLVVTPRYMLNGIQRFDVFTVAIQLTFRRYN